MIDYALWMQIGLPLATAALGGWAVHAFERRAKLIVYYGHAARHRARLKDQDDITINTHTTVLQNSGSKSAEKVRIFHALLPTNYEVQPATRHQVITHDDDSGEIEIERIDPGEQYTISYLYFPPTTIATINSRVLMKDGRVRVMNVLPSRMFPRWLNRTAAALLLVGAVTVIYFTTRLVASVYYTLIAS